MKTIRIAFAGLLLSAIACSDSTAPTETSPSSSPAAAAAAPLTFWQMSGGLNFTCAVTTDFVPYCWGDDNGGLGTGSEAGPDTCIGAVGPFACATTPARVAGDHRFRRVSAGGGHACGVTADFHAWCWGQNDRGQLGTGDVAVRLSPVAVSGGLRFRQVDAGDRHTCGITYPDNRLYCWGDNFSGQLGDGSLSRRLAPVPVLSDRRVSQVSAGAGHTCAVTVSSLAFCWGVNASGQLGDSTNALRRTHPVLVVGAHLFRQIDAATNHTCAVTTDDRAFCWGDGRNGEIGNGKSYLSFWPRAVSGGLHVRRVSVGLFFSCAETTSDQAWCWGSNTFGQLGNGGPPELSVLTPVRVVGGLSFGQLSAGAWHVCAKTTAGVGYCWGDGFFGALGNGTSGLDTRTFSPVAVVARE